MTVNMNVWICHDYNPHITPARCEVECCGNIHVSWEGFYRLCCTSLKDQSRSRQSIEVDLFLQDVRRALQAARVLGSSKSHLSNSPNAGGLEGIQARYRTGGDVDPGVVLLGQILHFLEEFWAGQSAHAHDHELFSLHQHCPGNGRDGLLRRRLHYYIGEAHKILQPGFNRLMLQAFNESFSGCRIMVAYRNQICIYHASIYRFCDLGPNGTAPDKPDFERHRRL